MSGLIPDPPPIDPADWPSLIRGCLFRGVYGGCVMCPDGTYDWWDLTAADLPPVVDRSGTPTDQVALHPRCVPDLVEHWGRLTADPDPGDLPETSDSPGAGVPPTDPFCERRPRARVGAYARRGEV